MTVRVSERARVFRRGGDEDLFPTVHRPIEVARRRNRSLVRVCAHADVIVNLGLVERCMGACRFMCVANK